MARGQGGARAAAGSTKLGKGALVALAGSTLLACRAHSPGAQGPSITVDPASCEANLVTLYTSGDTPEGYIVSLAAGPDGTAYFATMADGIWGLPAGAQTAQLIIPTRVTEDGPTPVAVDGSTKLWVDGPNLIVGTDGVFESVPTTGGAPTMIAQLPPMTAPALWTTGRAEMDAANFYVAAYGLDYDQVDPTAGFPPPGVWEVPRDGSAPQLLVSSNLLVVETNVPLLLDGTTLYTLGGQGNYFQVFGVATAGGSAAPIANASNGFFGPFRPLGEEVYVTADLGTVTRVPLDGSAPGTAIGGLDSLQGFAQTMVGDDDDAFVAFMSTPNADAEGNCAPPSCATRMAIARLPVQDEKVTASACSPEFTFGPDASAATSEYFPTEMALDASYVYVLATVGGGLSGPQVILRAPR